MKVRVLAKNPYDVLVERGILNKAGEYAKQISNAQKAAVITDDKVYGLYGPVVEKSLGDAGFSVSKFVFKNGEESKNIKTLEDILEFLASRGLTRTDVIIALGGGVVGDLAGFAAASYLRGIKFIQIPTTFLAAVDSSVGGKTGINLKAGKNLAGAFWQPSIVLCDTEAFKTLDEKTYADGLAEVVKYGIIKDESIIGEIKNKDFNVDKIVLKCVKIKADIVEADEFEKGERRLLNFGHTVGHAVEKLSGYGITHGHAVAIGMAVILRAYGFGGEIIDVIKGLNLPVTCPFAAEDVFEKMLSDKKREGSKLHLVVPERIGKCKVVPVEVNKVLDILKAGMEE